MYAKCCQQSSLDETKERSERDRLETVATACFLIAIQGYEEIGQSEPKNSIAWRKLGEIYLNTLINNVEQGIRCYRKAAGKGDYDSAKILQLIYQNGTHGIEQDEELASHYSRRKHIIKHHK
jgi:TPR repeat protein